MSIRKLSLFVGAGLLSSVAWALCYAQYQIEPDAAPPRTSHRVRVINDMGRAVCVKIIPFRHSNYFHADLNPGQSTTQEMWSGQRAMCVWDDNSGRLLIVSGVTINRSGKLRIRPMFAEAPKAMESPGGQQGAAPGVPSMEIEPD